MADAPSSDLAKTLVAAPPPPLEPPLPPPQQPMADAAAIPPTQVSNSPYGYDARAQQPPPPTTQYAPYAPQQPPPPQTFNAPAYQQQYTPQQQSYGAPPKANRKTLYIGVAAAVALLGVGLLLWFLLSGGSKSLGTYKNSLSDLMPNTVSGYSRATSGTLDDIDKGLDRDARRFFGYDDEKAGRYEHNEKKMLLAVANFSSPEGAKDALNKVKTQWRGPGVNVAEEGKSKNGDRIVYDFQPRPNSPKMPVVMWTNGSVLFAVGPALILGERGESNDTESSIPSKNDIVDFAKNFPY